MTSSVPAQAEAAKSSIEIRLTDLVQAVTSQLGVTELPEEHLRELVARLADDPVVRSLFA